MLPMLKEFLYTYVNSVNLSVVAVIVMGALLIFYCIFSSLGTRGLKKIINVFRKDTGDDVIRNIEKLRLSKRYAKMWEDYYFAYCEEDTVTLSSYLIKNELFVEQKTFLVASRATAVICFSVAFAGAILIPGLFEYERNLLICMFFGLLSIQAVLEIVYTALAQARKKRVARLIEEFEILSCRKLPGKAVDFKQRFVLKKVEELNEKINEMSVGIKQLNARLDRQYRLLEKKDASKQEKPAEQDTLKQENSTEQKENESKTEN